MTNVTVSDMKFDVVIGNPPYQGNNVGKNLWSEFVKLTFRVLNTRGYALLIHPSSWREPNSTHGKILREKNMQHLNIFSYKDGQRLFGVGTRFDIHCTQNAPYAGKTTITDEDNVVTEENLANWVFIPNRQFDKIRSLIATTEPIEMIRDMSSYHMQKDWMSKTKTDVYKYPCVYSVNRKDEPRFGWSSRNDRGHFGIPKVIWGNGATGFIADYDGSYGVTQWAAAIVESPENLDNVIRALKSSKFAEICIATSVSQAGINSKIMQQFTVGFWKELSDD